MKKNVFILFALLGMTQVVAQNYEYVPFVREGVKWVCYYRESKWEKGSSFNANDDADHCTVYFTLQMEGDTVINGKTYKLMHKYSEGSVDEQNDTIPICLREEDRVVYGVVPNGRVFQDCPVTGNFSSGVNWYDGEEHVLYDFNEPIGFLNQESLYDEFKPVTTDTIMAGLHKVKRSLGMYYDYEFFVIEGIGIDEASSYTLSFFVPAMTGNIDGFGLSHVIEDGEIIYKGLNYDPIVGIDEVVADGARRPLDANYYNLMGQPVGHDVPTTPGIYIHQGKKIVVR